MRLFFALPVPPGARAALAGFTRAHRADLPFRRFVHPDDYHLTVAFLGELPDAVLPALLRSVDRLRPSAPGPLRIRLEALGAFGPAERPRVLVARGRLDPEAPFLRYRDALVAALADEGIAVDRKPFVPHVTLARDGTAPLPDLPWTPIAYAAADLVLFRSDLGKKPMYTPLQAWPL
ncbi:RNA 2',3'-cyclic phosphodiesterase [Hydrogenibacillus sp. N12]|uniref:RNA 2',3'-cyclic phosphodiesterase n=1 Tax=Hydrogenibacillus sp. N12 TaxID=2866627 RepID=UPI001C7DDA4F|nr:RNA 2',3'-cyclic phosphodiesterase [Hydrogenibacillus sp. N12]QZA32097.1 RNA 2',3'-cyclic phosphodiesterase [Hydrogenibacillus sp. N12]